MKGSQINSHSVPVFSLLFILLDFVILGINSFKFILAIIRTRNQVQDNFSSERSQEQEEKENEKDKIIDKMIDWFIGFRLSILENNIKDFSFNAMLNLSVFPKFGEYDSGRIISFSISVYVISRCIFIYLDLWFRSRSICYIDNFNPKEISPEQEEFKKNAHEFEGEILLEGISEDLPPKKRSSATKLNIFFRLEQIFIPAILVAGQSAKNPVCITLFLLEFSSLVYFFSMRMKLKKKIFEGWFNFLSFLFVKVVIIMFSILGIFLDEWHTNDYAEGHQLNPNIRSTGGLLAAILIVMLLLSIFLEIFRAIYKLVKGCCGEKENREYFDLGNNGEVRDSRLAKDEKNSLKVKKPEKKVKFIMKKVKHSRQEEDQWDFTELENKTEEGKDVRKNEEDKSVKFF